MIKIYVSVIWLNNLNIMVDGKVPSDMEVAPRYKLLTLLILLILLTWFTLDTVYTVETV